MELKILNSLNLLNSIKIQDNKKSGLLSQDKILIEETEFASLSN